MNTSKNKRNRYLSALWATARRVMQVYPDYFGDDAEFRDWLEEHYSKRSTRDLSSRETRDAIDEMKLMLTGGQPFISAGQIQKLRALRDLLGWDQNRLFGFIAHQVKEKKSDRMLLRKEASKVIVGMQRMLAGSDKELYDTINRASSDWLRSKQARDLISSHTSTPDA